MYTLTLTANERAAFDFVGDRYATGHDWSVLLCNHLPENACWDDDGDITFEIPEHVSWELRDLAESEDMMFPLFDNDLHSKLIDFLMEIV